MLNYTHALAKNIRHARLGSIRENHRETQLSVACSLNLAALCIEIWNTVHIFKTASGKEPVRDYIRALPEADRAIITENVI